MAFEIRPFQKQAIQLLTADRASAHVICVAATGSGKSYIYEKVAATSGRRTLLVTPLVALARQQGHKLRELGIPTTLAAGGNPAGPPPTSSGAWVVSPEALLFSKHRRALMYWQPNFLVLDECHCLWEWGERFRPAFNLIPPLLKEFGIARSLWLTATLPFPAREQLRRVLPACVEIGSFALSAQLHLRIEQVDWEDRASRLLQWMSRRVGFGIIFVTTRQGTQRLTRLLTAAGKKCVAYHAGLSAEERANLEAQIANHGPDVVVATSAFGMGMHFAHLNYVVLWQAPPSLLSLVQTVGRVGRNENRPGEALVLWDYEDLRLLEWTLKDSAQRREDLMALTNFLRSPVCRSVGLKQYFDQAEGGNQDARCGHCDICAPSPLAVNGLSGHISADSQSN